MGTAPIPRLSVEEYLAADRLAEEKCEYYDGEAFPVVAASIAHARIVPRLSHCLLTALSNSPCYPMASLRVRVSRTKYVYPDIAVVCGKAEITDEHNDTLTNPKLIVEVLSHTTMDFDMGSKFHMYCNLPSFEEYVLVHQLEPKIEVRRRASDGSWVLRFYSGLEATVPLESLGIRLQLSDIYDGIEFPA